MVACNPASMLENHLPARAHDKHATLLPQVTLRPALLKPFFHGRQTMPKGSRPHSAQKTSYEVESPVGEKILVHIHLAIEFCLYNKQSGLFRSAAADGDHGNPCCRQPVLDRHQFSNLLT